VGDKVTLAASVDADAGVTNRTVTWTSSNTAVATVDGTGLVTAVNGGTATVVAKSVADPTVSGAAVVQVAANVPATVTIGQINQTVCVVGGGCTSVPATLSNVANQLDVTLNVDAGTQTLAGVDLIMNCGGADTVVASQNLGSTDKAPIAAEDASAPVTLSFNTAAFNATNGQVAFKNGACTLKARARTAAGTQTASSSTSLTLNNVDFVSVTTTTTPSTGQLASAPGANGLVWRAGAVTVAATPVMYSGATIASGTISLVNGGGDNALGRGAVIVGSGAAVSTLSNLTATAGVISATFPNTTSSTAQGVSGATVDTLFTVVTTVSSTGNAGPSQVLPAPAAIGTNFIRLDNLAPDITTVPAVNYNVQNNQNNWLGSAFVFTTTGSTPVITLAAATTADNGGVDVVKVNTFARPAGTGTYAQFTKVSDLAETSSASAYDLRLQVCDALGNCASTGTSSTTIYANFGVDLTAPTLTQLAGGVRDGSIYSIANPIPATADFSVFDPVGAGGVSGSGTSTNGLLVKDQGLNPNGIPGSKTTCPIGVTAGSGSSITCSAGVLQPNSIVLPAAAKVDGEYTMVVQAADQAGNLSAAQTIKYYTDITVPTIPAQGVTIPNPITVNTAFNGFSATDNMDVKAGYGSLVYTAPAFKFAEGGTATPAGAAFDNVLTQQSTVGTTLATFYKSLTNAVGTIGTLPTSIDINVTDVAGNLSGAALSTALPAANIGAVPAAAFSSGTNAITAFSIDSTAATSPATAGQVVTGRSITFYVNATPASDLTGNPLSQVCFFWQPATTNQFGSGAQAGDLVKLGCTGGSGTVGVGATRRFFYTFNMTFPAAFGPAPVTIPVYAVGNTSTLDAIISAAVNITIIPAP
jgi:hypothetical protein